MSKRTRRAERWEDVRAAVAATVRRFVKDTGWRVDMDEAMAEAGLVFAECRKTLDRVRASLQTWVCLRVYKRLCDARRKAAQLHRRLPTKTESDLCVATTDPSPLDYVQDYRFAPREFDLLDFVRPLPGDAAVLVWLSLNPPGRLTDQTRAGLRAYLVRAGWSESRIRRAFALVHKHLKGR